MPTFHARFCSKMDQKGVILGQKWGPKTTLFSVFSIRVLGLTGPNSGVKSGTTFWSEPVKNPFLSLFFTFFHFFSCFFRPSFLEVMDRLLLPCEFFSYFGVFWPIFCSERGHFQGVQKRVIFGPFSQPRTLKRVSVFGPLLVGTCHEPLKTGFFHFFWLFSVPVWN